MEFFKNETQIDFMGLRKITGLISLVFCLIALGCIWNNGLSLGLEFTGGAQVELRYDEPITANEVKTALEDKNFHDLRVQTFGSTRDILIRLANDANIDEHKLSAVIKDLIPNNKVTIRRIEFVGSEVGEQLVEQGGMAIFVALIATMVYIVLRFEYRFALSAVAALTHDVIIVLGIFAFFHIDFDLATLAAILAVVGYSLNDTIVVFDRVRENFRKIRGDSTSEILNLSINQTLSRTIMTSFLTLLVIIALLFYGGESLYGFSLALCIGIIVGTYSSIFVASGLALTLGLSRADLLPRPTAAVDEMP